MTKLSLFVRNKKLYMARIIFVQRDDGIVCRYEYRWQGDGLDF